MMGRAYAILTGLVILTACASPRAQCESDVDKNIAALKQAIATSEANLERGFGLKTELRPRLTYGLCVGNTHTRGCLRDQLVTQQSPVAIDLDAEERRLASAKRRLALEESHRAADLAECAFKYPT